MSISRYQDYKDSGVEWLGEVPAHWTIEKFKRVFRERDERSRDGSELLLSVSAYTGVSPRSDIIDDGDHLSRADSLEGYRVCYPNDLVMNIMLAWNRGLGFSGLRGIVSPAYCVFQVINGTHSRFLDYLVRSDEYTSYFKAFSTGVIDSRLRLYPDVFGLLSCSLPPLGEQSAIATFLDRETAKIDALKAEQKRLIDLLREKRQAVISHAVIKGLDPNAGMKNSGIEWLGDVPKHWEVGRISSLSTKITNGYVGPTRDILVDEGVRYLQSLHIEDNRIRFDTPYFVREDWSQEHSKSILEYGDVLIVQTGGDIGQVAVVTKEYAGCNCHALIIVSPVRSLVSGDWIAWVLNADYGFHSLLSIRTGALHPHLNCGDVKDLFIPVPPISEQQDIVRFISARLDEFNALVTEAETAIALLQERRSALISAAVTGKIDVRGLLPSEAEAA
jgi:type I restriction enzyme, S subunit